MPPLPIPSAISRTKINNPMVMEIPNSCPIIIKGNGFNKSIWNIDFKIFTFFIFIKEEIIYLAFVKEKYKTGVGATSRARSLPSPNTRAWGSSPYQNRASIQSRINWLLFFPPHSLCVSTPKISLSLPLFALHRSNCISISILASNIPKFTSNSQTFNKLRIKIKTDRKKKTQLPKYWIALTGMHELKCIRWRFVECLSLFAWLVFGLFCIYWCSWI
ncbi:hypothetical protein Pfo_013522, partial [Paulownia fortunei]